MGGLQHRVGLPYSRRITEEDLQMTTPLAGLIALQNLQQLIGVEPLLLHADSLTYRSLTLQSLPPLYPSREGHYNIFF